MEKLLEVLNLLILRSDFKSKDIVFIVLAIGVAVTLIILARKINLHKLYQFAFNK